jgi:amidase
VSVRDIALPGLEAAYAASLTIIAFETFAAFGHLVGTGLLGRDVEERLAAAKAVTRAEVDAAEEVRSAFTREVDASLDLFDALALPTMPHLPPLLGEAEGNAVARMTALTRPFNLSGHPAISVPATHHAPIGSS